MAKKVSHRSCVKKILLLENELARLVHLDKKKDSEIKRIKEQLDIAEKTATYDHLTGLLNRRGGDEVLNKHYSILRRNNCNENDFAVLLLDLDRFKGINDTYGHNVGDLVLKFFGKTLLALLRKDFDTVVRLGGDEFMVVMPKSSRSDAEIVKDKIKLTFAKNLFTSRGLKLCINTSVGIALARKDNGKKYSLKKMIQLADEAMYMDKEKRTGRRKPK